MSLNDGCAAALILALACGCGPDLGPGADYYFPAAELTGGLVYAYEGAGPTPAPPHYWYYRGVAAGDSLVLAATYYDHDFEPRQFVRERLAAAGALQRELRLFTPTDSASLQVSAEVLAPALFSFLAPEPERVLVNAVRFADVPEAPAGTSAVLPEGAPAAPTYTVTRNRSYLRDTLVAALGAPRRAQLWLVRERSEQDSAGVLAIDSRAVELYAEGVGLVYRERVFPDGTVEVHRLRERFPMDTLEARAARAAGRR